MVHASGCMVCCYLCVGLKTDDCTSLSCPGTSDRVTHTAHALSAVYCGINNLITAYCVLCRLASVKVDIAAFQVAKLAVALQSRQFVLGVVSEQRWAAYLGLMLFSASAVGVTWRRSQLTGQMFRGVSGS